VAPEAAIHGASERSVRTSSQRGGGRQDVNRGVVELGEETGVLPLALLLLLLLCILPCCVLAVQFVCFAPPHPPVAPLSSFPSIHAALHH